MEAGKVTEQLWGGETTKAVENFPVSGEQVPVPVLHWLGRLKAAAARVNSELGRLDSALAERIDARRQRGGVAGQRADAGGADGRRRGGDRRVCQQYVR